MIFSSLLIGLMVSMLVHYITSRRPYYDEWPRDWIAILSHKIMLLCLTGLMIYGGWFAGKQMPL